MQTPQTLGIAGLDTTASGLEDGAVYLLASESPPLVRALLFGNLPAGVGRPLLLVSRADPAMLPDTAGLDARLEAGSAALLAPRESRAAPPGRLVRQLAELATYRRRLKPADGPMLLALDDAESYLPLDDGIAAQHRLQHLLRWTATTGHTLLLLFAAQRLDLLQLTLLERLGGDCAGLAIGQAVRRGHYTWQIRHWKGWTGEAADLFPLTQAPDGRLHVAASPSADVAPPPSVAHDRLRVLATRASLPDSLAPPPNWQLFDNRAALLDAAADAVAATVLFDSADNTGLPEMVHRLRLRCGRQLKILVREIGNSRLRHSDEQLLLNLGANAVLPAELGFNSVLSLTDSLQQAVFHGPLDGEHNALFAASLPESDRGYLPPARFAAAVSAVVERSRTIGIHNAWIRLKPAPGIRPLDALRLCRFKRAGDLCCADGEHVYLFLFACRNSDVDTALHHLFRLPLGELFVDEVRSLDPDSIRQALKRFRLQDGFARLDDLSGAIHEQQTTPQPARLAPRRETPQQLPERISLPRRPGSIADTSPC
ncbi:cellulose biosynthesis protein BcsE [Crenobacter luteus]|nr:cellulose biosynthesis protein BcsE [Crenobacter luteus]